MIIYNLLAFICFYELGKKRFNDAGLPTLLLIISIVLSFFETSIKKHSLVSFFILFILLIIAIFCYHLWKIEPKAIHKVIQLQYFYNTDRNSLLRVPEELVIKEANYYEVLK